MSTSCTYRIAATWLRVAVSVDRQMWSTQNESKRATRVIVVGFYGQKVSVIVVVDICRTRTSDQAQAAR